MHYISWEVIEADNVDIDNVNALLFNWYDAALYYLQKGDFLRNHDIRTVQAIAILGIVFNNVGDYKLHTTLWGCGIRIAQSLKLGEDRANTEETRIQTEVRRRLWWTLVLCEWFPTPYHAPCIIQADFQVELPAVLDDDELERPRGVWEERPRPIQYHLVMINIAAVYHRFRWSLRLCSGKATEVSALVLKTDEALANVIEDLPPHLQNGQMPHIEEVAEDTDRPWIAWQRTNLCLVLFYHRIAVNRVMQDQWVQDPATFARTRAICLGSAHGIIALSASFTTSLAKYRPW